MFVQAEGDLVPAGTDTRYQNVYVFKFEFRDGHIVHIDEYANPVAYSLFAGLPLLHAFLYLPDQDSLIRTDGRFRARRRVVWSTVFDHRPAR
uniref:hypothetical protein n=1 Tax=Paractinoplanes polyasparticus TaxID=2856853 RepID=UPI001C84B13D|nr:hypothetical protein [Actinoplanes polyasparticus]